MCFVAYYLGGLRAKMARGLKKVALFRLFRRLLLGEDFFVHSSKKSITNSRGMKTICEFYQQGVFFSCFRWLPIEGTFFSGQILTLIVKQMLLP